MSDNSVQKWLERNRPPRVRITYEVHTGGAIEKRELPFIVGVFADLSGDGAAQLPKFKDRQMLPIDRDSFDDVLRGQKPSMLLKSVPRSVPNLKGEAPQPGPDGVLPPLSGSLVFGRLDDFSPVPVIRSIPVLNRLYCIRGHLRALQARAETNTELSEALDALMQPSAQAQRQALMVLARPQAATPEKAAEVKLALATLAATLAAAPDDSARAKLATDWGVKAKTVPDRKNPSTQVDDDAGTVAVLRTGLGFYSVRPEELPAAKALLRKLVATDAAKLPEAEPPVKAAAAALGLTAKNLDSLVKLLNPVVATLDAPTLVLATDADDKTKAKFAADQAKLEWALLATAVVGSVAQPEEESPSVAFQSGPSEREQLEAAHDAANRYFATNLLLNLRADAKAPPLVWPQLEALNELITLALPSDAPAHERQQMLSAIGQFALQVLMPLAGDRIDLKALRAATAIDVCVSRIDVALSAQLSAVMQSSAFRALEATWRGLHYLVSRAETGALLKLRVFNASWLELLDDMERAVEQDQSHVFKTIYEAEYGTLGGDPYSMLVGGYELGRAPQDIEFLQKIAAVAAAAHAPFITAAAPSLFGLTSFGDLARPRDLEKIFEGVDLAGWREFRSSEDSRYVSMVLPHALLRLPYGQDTWPVPGLGFEEDVGTADRARFLWGNAAYLLAERITHAFSLYGWTAAIRGVEGGGLIEGLPLYTYEVGDGTRNLFCPTEVAITDRREKELNDLGFISLCHSKGKGQAAFFGGQTTNLPKKYITDEANANARLSSLLPYMLSASRFAHYIKVIMRDKVGSFLTRSNVESFLNTWITQYVLLDENAMQEAKAAFPLSQANVVVTDVPGDVRAYHAVVFLRPHFQLEELTTSIRLVAKVPA